MLQIYIPKREFLNSETNEFIYVKETTLNLEHSLVSISKWEAKWCKPFLTDDTKTREELRDYIRCMTIDQKVDPLVYMAIPDEEIKRISDYIKLPMTATTFSESQNKPRTKKQIVTSELIYYWMTAYNIPWEAQKWHINRLLTLIRICGIKNDTSKKNKMNKQQTAEYYKNLNEQRKAAMHTKG